MIAQSNDFAPFWEAVASNPRHTTPLLIAADAASEMGDEVLSDTLRWAALNGKRPLGLTWTEQHYMWSHAQHSYCHWNIPTKVYKQLIGYSELYSYWGKYYDSLAEAYAYLAIAFNKAQRPGFFRRSWNPWSSESPT
jgi:hypothetical protein